jgi:hypothetical protein
LIFLAYCDAAAHREKSFFGDVPPLLIVAFDPMADATHASHSTLERIGFRACAESAPPAFSAPARRIHPARRR